MIKKKFRRIAAICLASAMLIQSSVQGFAAETAGPADVQAQTAEGQIQAKSEGQTQATEAQTQATEAQTQATEAQTQATEAQTQSTEAQTQATETQTQATEAQTQATESQTQVTESQTQAPEGQTQAAGSQTQATEAQTQATESQTQAASEKSTESQTEGKETERSERVNDGEKFSSSQLETALGSAFPYLFAADTVEIPESLSEDKKIAEGEEGSSIVSGLVPLSVKLANAVSSSDVEVVNLYADEKGKLDTAQLDEITKKQVIDVTKKYYIVNIVADHADQDLDFSGYKMTLSGQPVTYEEETQPGDILYNFVSLDGDKYQDYTGTLKLSNGAGLQGAFLAPRASVQIQSGLAGAVYAHDILVSDTVTELLQIVFIQGQPESITEETKSSETESGAEATESSETESGAEESKSEQIESSAVESTGESTGSEMPEDADAITADGEEEVLDLAEYLSDEEEIEPLDGDEGNTGSISLTVIEEGSDSGETLTYIQNAVFVVKDFAGNILKDSDGKPMYLITYNGNTQNTITISGFAIGKKYILSQISTDEGYEIAEDQAFKIPAGGDSEGSASPEALPVKVTNRRISEVDTNSISVKADAFSNGVLLTAEEGRKSKYYAALFSDQTCTARVSAVKEVVFDGNAQKSQQIVFRGLEAGARYYLAPTNELGEALPSGTFEAYEVNGENKISVVYTGITFSEMPVTREATDPVYEQKTVELSYLFSPDSTINPYPEGDFSYIANIKLTKNLLDQSGNALIGQADDTFYVDLYRDSSRTQKVTQTPITFAMQDKSTMEATYELKMTAGKADFYLSETDQNGKVVGGEKGDSVYTVSYLPNADGKLSIVCGSEFTAQIRNQINASTVSTRLVDAKTGKHISGVTMVIKDQDGKVVYNNGKALVFQSKDTDYVLENVLETGKNYYLSQVAAPSGYAPSADVAFEVARGMVTEVVMQSSAAEKTSYSVTVNKQVYSGKYQVYAQDDTNGTNAANGSYTFHVALFADANHTQKVSDVQAITVKGLSGVTTFENVQAKGSTGETATYYVAETDQYGEPLTSTGNHTIKYAKSGKVTMDSKSKTTLIQNVYSSLPDGYRYTAKLTLTKKVVKSTGAAEKVTETFYAGIFRESDYSGTPTIIKLDLQDASSVQVSRRILLPSKGETTYYIAEVDENGSILNQSEEFGYTVEIDKPTLKISKGDDASVTITNQPRASKVTLYLTKKVYQGTLQKKVNETFYVGLFKDSNFTTPYTKPIPMKLENKSELTLKLSLNLGSSSSATIYVAEVDKDGKVIKNEQGFGYEIKLVNSTAAFTPEKREIQTIILNSVYGSVTADDWKQILHEDGNYLGSDEMISGNGEASVAAQTGDGTPITFYVILMAVSVMILGVCYRKKRRCKL